MLLAMLHLLSVALFAQPAPNESTGGWGPWIIVGTGAAVVAIVLLVIVGFAYGNLWLQANTSGAKIRIVSLIGMSLRQVNPKVIVKAKVMAVKGGLDISSREGISTRRLEAHYLAGGNVMGVVQAVIQAQRAGIELDFDRAAAIDLAGRDVVDAVRTSVLPKVIECPDSERGGKNFLSAIAMDGIELKVRARVTVRTNLEQLIGGATEDTVIARVGESIISAIGSAETHSDVLKNPDMITRKVLDRGLDAQTAFAIVSIDIADVDVGENVGARLSVDQAEADTRMRRAEAEQRRAEAVAFEQEMKAKVSDNRSKLILAEAEVPKAMAEAFRQGNVYGQNGPA